jgi:hypothetical protein
MMVRARVHHSAAITSRPPNDHIADSSDQGITGEVLCHVDLETLTDIGVSSVGHRLKILRAVYEIKLESGIEIGEEDWRPQGAYSYAYEFLFACPPRRTGAWAGPVPRTFGVWAKPNKDKDKHKHKGATPYKTISMLILTPPDDVSSAASNSRLWDLYTICQKQIQSSHEEAQRMRSEMAHLRAALGQLTQELQDRGIPVTASIPTLVEDAVAGTPTAPMAIGSLSSPVTYTADLLTPRPPLQRNGSSSAMRRSQSIHDATIAGTNRLPAVELTAPGGSSKSRLNADSLCTAVLPAALKKYKIHDDWKQYCLFICYEDRGECKPGLQAFISPS